MFWTVISTFLQKAGSIIFNGIKKFFRWDSEQGKWLSPVKTFIILGLVIYIIYTHSCTRVNCPTVTETTDTVTVTHIDTVWIEKTQTTVGKKPIRKGGGTTVVKDPKTPCDSLFQYTQEYDDSLIKGILTADVKGTLIGSSFTYTPKFPKYIHRVDTITITNTKIIKEVELRKRPYGLIVGGGVNGAHDQTFGFTIDAGVQFKQGFDIIYRFDPIRTTHSLGVTYTFEFNKK